MSVYIFTVIRQNYENDFYGCGKNFKIDFPQQEMESMQTFCLMCKIVWHISNLNSSVFTKVEYLMVKYTPMIFPRLFTNSPVQSEDS